MPPGRALVYSLHRDTLFHRRAARSILARSGLGFVERSGEK
jgi:hypothetical protein